MNSSSEFAQPIDRADFVSSEQEMVRMKSEREQLQAEKQAWQMEKENIGKI